MGAHSANTTQPLDSGKRLSVTDLTRALLGTRALTRWILIFQVIQTGALLWLMTR